jgi:tetratricopeptide (TPR) repeat protein
MPSLPSDLHRAPALAGHVVVFTGKLSSLGRRDARALVARLGGQTTDDVNARTTMLVVGAEGFGASADGEKSVKLKRAEELNAQQGARISILSEEQFCRVADVPTLDELRRQYHSLRDLLARYGHLREDHVRYLIKCGIVRPAVRTNAELFFPFTDLAALKRANAELGEGAAFRTVVKGLMAAQEGQLALDFRLDASPAKIVAIERRSKDRPAPAAARARDTELAEEFFRAASFLDDGDPTKQGEAAAAYRRALELDPYLVPALINLANIHYSRDELIEAQALYERAINLETDFFEAHFNLGNIYHDLGMFADAEHCYSEAIRLNPSYPDAHFYLAVTLEKMGLPRQAHPHWRTYRELAPNGEWVELAKEFSD